MIIQLFLGFITLYNVDAASLFCYESEDNYSTTPLDTPLNLLTDPRFVINNDTVIYAHGYDGTPEEKDSSAIVSAYNDYKRHNNLNFLMLDWEYNANGKAGEGIQTAEKIGQQLGDALVELSKNGLDLERVHLVGHSLGAHLMGYAGKRTQQNGKTVQRITGLDPVPSNVGQGLRKTDAKFVDVLHTDPRYLGSRDTLGHVDIWANCDMMFQPGCPDETKAKCSHLRAPKYFAEAIRFPTAFPALVGQSCGNWLGVDRKHNMINRVFYLGEHSDMFMRGHFYLRTNPDIPYGRGVTGLYP